MNNFRPHHAKPLFGSRNLQQSPDLPNPWMTEEEVTSMRRQTPQQHSFMQNASNLQPSHLNQSHMLSMPNKSYINESSCKMTGPNFTRLPNPNIFKPAHGMNETNYQNRISDRFSYSNSFSNVNIQYKNSEGTLYKDIPVSSMMNLQSHRSQSLSDNVSRPWYSNARQPQERFSCMQSSETQFHSKYDNSQMFEGKEFPVTSDKGLLMQSTASFTDKVSNNLPNNFMPYKQSIKSTNLFPAYAPKDTIQDESSKLVQSPGCNSDFSGKSNSFCDKTEFPNRYTNALQQLKGKADTYQESTTTEINELFTQPNNPTSFMYDKQSYKDVPKSQISHDSFKSNVETVSSSNAKFSFSPDGQQSCFQSNEMPFHKPTSLQISDLPTSTASKDCFMQNTQFSSQSDNENLKESFSSNSFNFETGINVSDIADLLPGLDAILKETLNKSEELPKNDLNKSNSAFSDDEWSKHSIPFIGDKNQVCNNGTSQSNNNKDIAAEYETRCKETNILKSPNVDQIDNELMKEAVQKDTTVDDTPKVQSALEEAIEMLVKGDAIVGLDFVVEYKKNICQKDSFPFRCKLCNSAITRPSIIDHILGSKHRMRYLKTKDEAKYESIISLKIEKRKKEEKIAEIALELETLYGRGHVVVNVEDFQKDSTTTESTSPREADSNSLETVITLDKIPIGFEALSPQHDDTNSGNFDLDHTLNQDTRSSMQKGDDMAKSTERKLSTQSKVSDSEFSLPCLSAESSPNFMSKFPLPPSDSIDSSSHSNSKLEVESSGNQIQQSIESSGPEIKMESGAVKRSASPDTSSGIKLQKLEKSCDEVTDEQKPLEIKKECDSPSGKKVFDPNLFDELSKCTISSEEEASFALQAINILMEMYMRYKLQHVPLDLMETMMKSLQSRSPDKMEEIIALLNDNKISNINDKSSALSKEANDLMELDNFLKDHAKGKRQEHPVESSSSEMKIQEPNLLVNTTTSSSGTPFSLTSTDPTVSLHSTSVTNDTLSVSISQTSTAAAFNNVSKNEPTMVADSAVLCQVASSMNPQVINPVCLKPPPFFKWPQTTEASALSNQVSYANVQGNQSMMWTTAYQQSQLPYAQLPYYQPQSFGNTFTGTHAYPTQFPVLTQNSVQMNMTAPPPLPPPLPPPPPVPSDSRQPCYPNSSSIPKQTSQSASSNSPYIAPFSKPPPPPLSQ